MYFIILAASVLVASIIVGVVWHEHNEYADAPIAICCALAIIAFAALSIMGIEAITDYAQKDLTTKLYAQKHDALVMQYESNFYNKITYDGRKELVDQIIEYNVDVTKGQMRSHNGWFNVFYPEDWDSLQLIDLNKED